jgi:hypothetical protein
MARIHAAGALDVIPWIAGALFLSGLLWPAELLIFLVLAAPAGISRKDTAAKIAEDFFSNISASSVIAGVLIPVLVVLLFRPIGRLVLDRSIRSQTTAKRRAARTMRRRSRLVLFAVPSCLLGLVGAFALLTHSWVPALMGVAHLLTPMGAVLLPLGLLNRNGARTVCGKCGYPMGSWRGAPDRCPECGNPWHDPWNARCGDRRIRGGVVLAGALCLGLAVTSAALAGSMLGS